MQEFCAPQTSKCFVNIVISLQRKYKQYNVAPSWLESTACLESGLPELRADCPKMKCNKSAIHQNKLGYDYDKNLQVKYKQLDTANACLMPVPAPSSGKILAACSPEVKGLAQRQN